MLGMIAQNKNQGFVHVPKSDHATQLTLFADYVFFVLGNHWLTYRPI